MEIINRKEIKRFTIIIGLITFVLTFVPIILYFYEFNDSFSKSNNDWGTFGDFIGGIVGTVFNLVAVIFSFISIYITLRIAIRLHENEQANIISNINREEQKFAKEIELVHKQNKPYPYINLSRFHYQQDIELFNYGPGTLIVNKIEIIFKDEIFENFRDLFKKEFDLDNYNLHEISLRINHSKTHVLNSGIGKTLLLIKPISESIDDIEQFKVFNRGCSTILNNCSIKIYYQDIFGTEDIYKYSVLNKSE